MTRNDGARGDARKARTKAVPSAEKDAPDPLMPAGKDGRALSLLLRRAARDYLGIQEGDYWPSDLADAQARAAIKAGWTCVTPPAVGRNPGDPT